MKQCIALALALCLTASGCAQSEMMGRRGGEAGYLATSRRAPRPLITRDASKPSARMFGQHGVRQAGYCELGCTDGCSDGGMGGGCNCNGCACGGPCQRMAERVATGFCACPAGHAMCPHAGGYPEASSFNGGPPVGQVAYPYYTTRGPRDFLLDNPPNIGPY